MASDRCELIDVRKAFMRFAFPSGRTQTSQHIKPLHWYVACRLVIEGGFNPDDIEPRPPFIKERIGNRIVLHHVPTEGGWTERTIYGGLKTKDVDVSVCINGIGPVLAVSLKGTHNAFRNLTNRMEEAAGDCTNIHMAYPALVYGFWHVLRANEESDSEPSAYFGLDDSGRYKPADIAVMSDNSLSPGVQRLAQALERLSEHEDLRDPPSRYEACGLTLVGAARSNAGEIHPVFPPPDHTLDFNRMFSRLYELYDRRYVYHAPALAIRTHRIEWSDDSPIFGHTLADISFREMHLRFTSAND